MTQSNMDNSQEICVHQEKNVLVVKFNRPSKKNAFSRDMYERLTEILNDTAKKEDIAVTVLTGEGDFYSSGNDLTFAAPKCDKTNVFKKPTIVIQQLVDAFIKFPKILVALVNGPAIGIAATTLALCDIVYASNEAFFLTPFTKLGLSAEGCSTYTFPKLLGTRKATEMLLFNHKMSSSEALQCGFVTELFTPEEINTKAWDKIFEYARLPQGSLLNSKKLLKDIDMDNLILANMRECDELENRFTSDEFVKAIIKFSERRSNL